MLALDDINNLFGGKAINYFNQNTRADNATWEAQMTLLHLFNKAQETYLKE